MSNSIQNKRNFFVALKSVAGVSNLTLSLPVGSPVQALLRPVPSDAEWINDKDLQNISNWRNRFVSSFLTEFHAEPQRTLHWLTDVVGMNESKILFMLDLPDGSTVGHLGIDFINWETGYGEIDAIVRGGEAPKGLMTNALRTMLLWADTHLGLKKLDVRVRSDNTALNFYLKVGFKEYRRVPLRRIEDINTIRWIEDSNFLNAEIFLIYMSYHTNE